MPKEESVAHRATEMTLQGRLIHPNVLVGTIQDSCTFHQFAQLLVGQGAIARERQSVAWIREVQNLLVRYEHWPLERACALVAQADPTLNLRPGETTRADLSNRSVLWDNQVGDPAPRAVPRDVPQPCTATVLTGTAPARLGRVCAAVPRPPPVHTPVQSGMGVIPMDVSETFPTVPPPSQGSTSRGPPSTQLGTTRPPVTGSTQVGWQAPRSSVPLPFRRQTPDLPTTPQLGSFSSPRFANTGIPPPPTDDSQLGTTSPPATGSTPVDWQAPRSSVPPPFRRPTPDLPTSPQLGSFSSPPSTNTWIPPPPSDDSDVNPGKRKRPRDEDQFGDPPRKVRESQCPVRDCSIKHRRIRLHTYRHFPECIRPWSPETTSENEIALLTVVPRLENLMCLLDNEWHDRVGEVTPPMAEEIQEFSRQMLWQCPTPITLQPVSAPVVLIHWRPFAFLWNQLSKEEREELKSLGSFGSPLPSASQPAGRRRHRQGGRRTRSGQAPTPRGATDTNRTPGRGRAANFTAPPRRTPTAKTQADGASGHAQGTRGAGRTTRTQTATSQQAPGAIPQPRVAQASPPEAYDSHFHLDRLEQRVQARGNQAIREEPGGPPRVPAAVVGGVLNYCDPERYREIVFPTNRAWKVAVGIHPKHAPRVDDRMLDQLEALVCDTRVAGISELGLDHSTPPATWGLQEKLLDRILRMGVSGRVLVIHARENDRSGDPYGEAIHCRIRELLLRRCTRHQRVQVHCASTSVAQVRAWGRAFPHTHFSFGRKVVSFTAQQQEALRAVPRDRLLLETDSPYFSGRGRTPQTPAYLGEVAALVGRIRHESPQEVMALTLGNALRLYGERGQ